MTEPLVSVIMPVYNAEMYLEESIRSVIEQQYKNWELWLIDDCSTDNSRNIIEKYAQQNTAINIIYLETNSGTAIARNTGITRSNGKYIAFLDADDLWMTDKLQKQIGFMETNDYLFSHTWYFTMLADGTDQNKIIKAKNSVSYQQLLKNNTIGCLTAVYNCKILGKMLMPDIRKRQDYGLWLNILKTGIKAYCLPEPLAKYRTGISSLSSKKSDVLKYNWQLLRKHQKLSFISSCYYFCCFIINKSFKYSGQ